MDGKVEALRRGATDGYVSLRPTRDDDRGLLGAWFSDPANSLPWCGLVLSDEEIAARFDRVEFDDRHGSFIVLAAADPVGYVAYDRLAGGEITLHVVLIPPARGRGLGSRALRLLGDVLLACLAPPRLLALPGLDNEAVIGALRNAGFTPRDPRGFLLERVAGAETAAPVTPEGRRT